MPKADLTTGIYPHCVVLADFNGDGKADLFVSKGSSGTVVVFRNASTGGNISFTQQLDLGASGIDEQGAAAGDLDGDGKPDIVISNGVGAASISVYRNTTSGLSISFATKVDYAVNNGPYAVAIGDLDGDGKPDIAVANNGANQITLFRNTSTPGNISFEPGKDITVGTNPYSIAIGDLDGDGKAELVITTQGGSSALSVLKNTSVAGTLSFNGPVDYATLSGSFIVTIGDLDGDGKPDLAAASSGANAITVIRNTTTAGSLSFGGQQNFATGSYPDCVAFGDLDQDGRPDMITANNMGGNVSILRNTSTTGAISFDAHVDYTTGANPLYVAVGDLDGDGRPDIVAANAGANAVSIFKNLIGSNLAPVVTSFTPGSGISGTVIKIKGSGFTGATSVAFGGTAAASFTVDSATGITATAGAGASGDVSVTTPYGTASLAGFSFNGPVITSFTPKVGKAGTVVTITGSNFSGTTDVQFGGIPAASFTVNSSTSLTATVAAGASGSVTVITPNGTAILAGFSFGAPTITSFAPGTALAGQSLTITGTNFSPTPSANIVYFGAVKATVTSAALTQLIVTVPPGASYKPISVTSNNLTGYSSLSFNPSFQPADSLTTGSFVNAGSYGTGTYPGAIAISDLDGDGKPDVIAANRNSNTIAILPNSSVVGAISFNTKVTLNSGPDPDGIAIGDLDGDGKPDLVIVNFNAGSASTISVFRNTSIPGSISFAASTGYSSGNGSLGLAIADMNGDGKPDILVTSGNSGFFSIFLNTTAAAGAITLAPKQDFTILSHADQLITADLDNDGRPDVVTSNFSGNNISVFRNTSANGVLSLGLPTFFAAGANPGFLSAGDLDGDGKSEVAVENYTSGTLSVYGNNSGSGFIGLGGKLDQNISSTTISFCDLNGDGKPDLLLGRGLTGIVSVLINTSTGAGAFTFAPNVDFHTGSYDTFGAAGDLDGDGKPELVVANTTLNNVTILRNRIGEPILNTMSAATAVKGTLITLAGSHLTGVTAVNFGGTPADSFKVISDTVIHAVVAAGASGNVTVVSNQGNGSLAGFQFIPEISAGGVVTTFCKGGSVLLTSTAAANNQWYKDGAAINGATSGTFAADEGGVYTVRTKSNGVITSSVAGITVTVVTVPAPFITRNTNNELMSNYVSGNQWYFNGTILPGVTGQTYLPTQSGSYAVKATVNGCVSDLSTPYELVLTGLINLGSGQYVNLYPNPVSNALNINWNINGMPALDIEISDFQGRKMLVLPNALNGTVVNLSGYPKGLYFIKIYSDKQLKINKTVRILKVE